MCLDPLSIIGAGIGAFGSIESGNARAKADEANAQQALIQAQAAQANAKTALDYGVGKADQIAQRVSQTIGAARTYYAAGNLDVNSGSPLLVQARSAAQGNSDRMLTLASALSQASGQNFVGAGAYSAQSQDIQAAGYDRMSGIIGAGTAILHGLGSFGAGGFGGSAGAGGFSGVF